MHKRFDVKFLFAGLFRMRKSLINDVRLMLKKVATRMIEAKSSFKN